jgi:hypothetical protein
MAGLFCGNIFTTYDFHLWPQTLQEGEEEAENPNQESGDNLKL